MTIFYRCNRCGFEEKMKELNYNGMPDKCPNCGVPKYDKDDKGYVKRDNLYLVVKDVVAEWGYYDSGTDYYMTKVIHFNRDSDKFEPESFISDMSAIEIQCATPDIQEKHINLKLKDKQIEGFADNIISLIENKMCPRCKGKIFLVKNEGFLWALVNKGLCSAPYKHSTVPKGSCREMEYVVWCPNCSINFVVSNYYRNFTIKVVKNLAEIGRIEIFRNMDGTINTRIKRNRPDDEYSGFLALEVKG